MLVSRKVEVSRSAEEVFAYLADFTTTSEWDPGSVKTELISGDGGVGTKYHNISQFNGKQTELVYEVVERDDAAFRIVLRGENKTVVATDTISVRSLPTGGCEISYSADFKFKGLTVVAAPFLRKAFAVLGDEAVVGLRKVFG
ncbi:MAG: hypothetical protein RL038_853 [Actinomycetota bacterium]